MRTHGRRWKALLIGAALAVAAVPASPEGVLERPAALALVLTSPGDTPVLLVPGWGDDASSLAALRGRLIAAGWRPEHAKALSFEDPVGSNRDHAREIEEAVNSLLALTGAPAVDVIAHSMGGLATRYYLANGDGGAVRRVVFLATPHEGTVSAFFVWGEGAREMQPGSAFLAELGSRPPVPESIQAFTIRTHVDVHVLPAESARLPGVSDVRVCCTTHAGLLDDDLTFARIARFLTDTP